MSIVCNFMVIFNFTYRYRARLLLTMRRKKHIIQTSDVFVDFFTIQNNGPQKDVILMVDNNYVNETKKHHSNKVLFSIIAIVFGIFLLFFPQQGLATIALIVGLVLAVFTVIYLIQYFKSQRSETGRLVRAVITFIFALLLLLFNNQVATYVLPAIIGIGILALAVLGIITANGYKKQNLAVWWLPLIGTIISVVISLLIFNNLQATSSIVAILFGIFILVFGFLSLFEWFTVQSLLKKMQ